MNLPFQRMVVAAAALGVTALTGCTLNSNPDTSPVISELGVIKGQAFGGNQPITGATVTVFAAATGGYGFSATQLGASTSSDSSGNFSVTTATNTCQAGQQVYIYVQGGNTGSGSNTNSGLLAVLGQCPASGTSLASVVPYVWVNEVSTVAAAYALAGFAVDPTHVADDEGVAGNNTASVAKAGMANAFATAGMLESIGTGQANTTTGNSTASGQTASIVVPQAQIYTLANILAACVNTASTATNPSTPCSTLLSTATSDGTATGSKPADTAGAAINIAHHPAANVTALYNLASGVGAPFQPADAAQPPDFTLSILYPQGGTATTGIAVDGTGNVFAAYGGGNLVYEITPAGTETTLPAYAPRRLAIDAKNNVWIPSTGASGATSAGIITEYPAGSSTATAFSAYNASGAKQYSLVSVALDQNDYLWALSGGTSAANGLTANLLPFPNNANATAALVTVVVPSAPAGMAISPTNGNLGVTSGATTNGGFSVFTDPGATVGTLNTTGGGLYTPTGTIADASGNFWVGNGASASSSTNTSISVISSTTDTSVTGAPYSITPPSGDTTTQLISGEFDGLGNYYSGGSTFATGTTTPNLPAIYQVGANGTQIAVLQPSTPSSVTGGGDAANQFVAVDPSGNLWFGATKYIGEMVGVAAPKVTPTVVANFPALPGYLAGTNGAPIPGTNNKVATRP